LSDASPPPDKPPDEAPGGARIIAIANQKGGVGKTTTAINLATAVAASGRRACLIDLDPQGNASTGLGAMERRRGSYELMANSAALAQVAQATAIPGLTLVPAEMGLAGAEIELVSLPRREFQLRDALSALSRNGPPAAFVFIDCPPSLGLLTLNALVAADAVLIPLQCEFFALEGLTQLTRTIEHVKRRLNPGLRMQGIALTMHDRRNNLSDLVAADARGFFGDLVYETLIPRNVRISEAPSHGKPVLLYDARSPGAQAYVRLAREMLARERMAVQ
jgi:chromosome partitioning protein